MVVVVVVVVAVVVVAAQPLANIDDGSLGAVQDLCHWNDFVKPRVHSNIDDRSLGWCKIHVIGKILQKKHHVHSNVKKRPRSAAS